MQACELAKYAVRLAVGFGCLEVLTHCIHANAFARFHLWTLVPQAESHKIYNGFAMAAMCFWKLIFLWLKFLVIWRVARLFALLDGINPPENMMRCASRSHASKPSLNNLAWLE